MSTILQVTIERPPAKESFTESYSGARLQVVQVTGRYIYRDGGWTGKPLFEGKARRVRKDGSLGVDLQRIPYGWEPDQETREQFARAAESIVRQAAKNS